MNRYLLLIFLSSWSLLVTNSHGCETGVALPGHILSVERSLLANADVAFLKTYDATSVESCMEDCCSGKFGSCSVASFRSNVTKDNCLHFYCRPLNKCKFLSSTSIDSFSFSSSSQMTVHRVPSSKASAKISSSTTTTTAKPDHESTSSQIQEHTFTKEEIATFSHEQFAMKNDNTTVKPRKGVEDLTPNELPGFNISRSGIKPRKGVTMEDVPMAKYLSNNITKSKVKPRKGVGPYSSASEPMILPTSITPSWLIVQSSTPVDKDLFSSAVTSHADENASDLISALEKVFEDDPVVKNTTSSVSIILQPTYSEAVGITATPPRSVVATSSYAPASSYSAYTSLSTSENTYDLKPSHVIVSETSESSFQSTPSLMSSPIKTNAVVAYTSTPSLIMVTTAPSLQSSTEFSSTHLVGSHESLRTDETQDIDEESENERKYKSSMHLVLSLVFGLLVLFAVLGVIAKRIYEGWLRRHYRRMDFLIDGMYNGYG